MFSIAKALAASQTNMIPFVAAGIFYYVFNLDRGGRYGVDREETGLLPVGLEDCGS